MNELIIPEVSGLDLALYRDEYTALVEECEAIVTEAVFNSRWALVEGYHTLGKTVREDNNFGKFTKGNYSFLQGLANNIGMGERTLYYALEFYDKYPKLDEVPEGKNISWNKIITKYLPENDKPELEKVEESLEVVLCPHCHKDINAR